MHDFKLFPELTNNQMQIYYFESPHKQITESFRGKVTKVTDGDTIHVKHRDRKKPVVIRLTNIAAPELKERGGKQSKSWLESQITGAEVDVLINIRMRVGKWGRILGEIIHAGMNINEASMRMGYSVLFEQRKGSTIPDFNEEIERAKIK